MSKMAKNKSNIEIRAVELRAIETDDNKMILEGYAAIFDEPANIRTPWGDTIVETIKRGAFDYADMEDVPFVYNHNRSTITARTRNKSLTLTPDQKGLKIRAEILDVTDGVDLYKRVKSGLIDKMSFAFEVEERGDTWVASQDKDVFMRDIMKVRKVWDVSAVLDPAYEGTSISARSTEFFEKEFKEIKDKIKVEDRSKQQQILLKLKLDSLNI